MPVPVVSFCLNHKNLNYEIWGSYFVTWQPSLEKVIINIEYHQPISFFYWYIQWFNIWFVWHLVFSNLRCVITPSKGIRILESGKLFFACGIWNPGPWNLEYSSRNLDLTNNWNPESKFHGHWFRNQEPGIWNPQHWIQNLKMSWIPKHWARRR